MPYKPQLMPINPHQLPLPGSIYLSDSGVAVLLRDTAEMEQCVLTASPLVSAI